VGQLFLLTVLCSKASDIVFVVCRYSYLVNKISVVTIVRKAKTLEVKICQRVLLSKRLFCGT
jgi:hypothetical protein